MDAEIRKGPSTDGLVRNKTVCQIPVAGLLRVSGRDRSLRTAAKIIELHANGFSIADIARKLEVTDAAISKRMRGMKLKRNPTYKKARDVEIIEIYRQGYSLEAIGATTSKTMTRQGVSFRLKKLGLKPHGIEVIPEEEIRRVYGMGLTIVASAKMLRRSVTFVSEHWEKLGHEPNPKITGNQKESDHS
jgi:transcriptional regulator with XRE-family HTH domain